MTSDSKLVNDMILHLARRRTVAKDVHKSACVIDSVVKGSQKLRVEADGFSGSD